MKTIFQNSTLELIKGDIVTLSVDAIVNAANKKLTSGGGVDGSIYQAAGPELLKAGLRLGGCETGEAKITLGYNLSARFVIHTVGPVYGQMDGMEASFLEDCYKNSLALADQKHLISIAFPSISTGAYGFPIEEAVPIALESVKEYLEGHPQTTLRRIVFVCYSEEDFHAYYREFGVLFGS
jgi:O-acetyl-ADP-ribose deacetylase (regulator of RNase III)